MGKVYSDEEIQMYSENPRVLHICRSQLTLTLEFRKELYAAWIKEPKPLTVRRMLEPKSCIIVPIKIVPR